VLAAQAEVAQELDRRAAPSERVLQTFCGT
jgi:hypothetical protein